MTNELIETVARKITKELNTRWNKGTKCNIWVCGTVVLKSSKKSKCSTCGSVIYYDSLVQDNFKKKHKKICIDCALKGDLNEEQRAILNRIWCNSKNVGEGK